jgi:hypothetical protein
MNFIKKWFFDIMCKMGMHQPGAWKCNKRKEICITVCTHCNTPLTRNEYTGFWE